MFNNRLAVKVPQKVLQSIRIEPPVAYLVGELTFSTVQAVLSEWTQEVAHSPLSIVDLEKVTHTDSAGVALLVELKRQTRDRSLTFRHLPAQMLSIATICGLEEAFFSALPSSNEQRIIRISPS